MVQRTTQRAKSMGKVRKNSWTTISSLSLGIVSGAYAYSSSIVIRCFSGDSFVQLSNGTTKGIASLQVDDQILTIDHFQLTSSSMLLMLDEHAPDQNDSRSSMIEFYTIESEAGEKISLTADHLIGIVSLHSVIYIPAKHVRLGDLLLISSRNQIQSSRIIEIRKEMKSGWFAPLTVKGTLLVNGILVSCFASVSDHFLAQMFLTPLRFYYRIFRLFSSGDPFNAHLIRRTLMRIYHWIYWSPLKDSLLL